MCRVVVITHSDTDGVVSAAIAKAKYPGARLVFTRPYALIKTVKDVVSDERRPRMIVIADLELSGGFAPALSKILSPIRGETFVLYADHHPATLESARRCPDVFDVMLFDEQKCAAQLILSALFPGNNGHLSSLATMAAIFDRCAGGDVDPVLFTESQLLTKALQVDPWDFEFMEEVAEKLASGKLPSAIPGVMERVRESMGRYKELLTKIRERLREVAPGLYMADAKDMTGAGHWGAVAQKLSSEVGAAVVLICPSSRQGSVVITARRPKHVDIDLLSVVGEACRAVGGHAGGHSSAIGGRIPVAACEAFEKLVALYHQRYLNKKKQCMGTQRHVTG